MTLVKCRQNGNWITFETLQHNNLVQKKKWFFFLNFIELYEDVVSKKAFSRRDMIFNLIYFQYINIEIKILFDGVIYMNTSAKKPAKTRKTAEKTHFQQLSVISEMKNNLSIETASNIKITICYGVLCVLLMKLMLFSPNGFLFLFKMTAPSWISIKWNIKFPN